MFYRITDIDEVKQWRDQFSLSGCCTGYRQSLPCWCYIYGFQQRIDLRMDNFFTGKRRDFF